ncbi:MAG: hypothetical protein M5R40_20480 [Anaerolineae bacterium]|nr:hypothetical protein [Anaerolineae bacterium]
MPRLSNADMGQVLAETVHAAGGALAHADLVAALTQAGHAPVVARLHALVRAGYLVRQLVPQPGGAHRPRGPARAGRVAHPARRASPAALA